MKVFLITLGSIFAILLIGLTIIGAKAPETFIYTGSQIPAKYINTIEELGLLEEGEQILYFYSDAIFDIKEGLYFVTERNLVLYCNEWEEPAEIIPLIEIEKVTPRYDDSFIDDSIIYIETAEFEMSFPLSSEKSLDRKFVEAIKSKMPTQ